MSLITEKEINQPAATDRAAEIYAPRMKVALVVRDVYAVKLCELYKKKLAESGSNWKCRIFDSMDHAQEWVES